MTKEDFKLEASIKNFVPPGWKEKISTVAFCPLIGGTTYDDLRRAVKYGKLENFLASWRARLYNKPYIIAAITKFFESEPKESNVK